MAATPPPGNQVPGSDERPQEHPPDHPSRLRRFLDWLIRLRGSPEAIGRGAAIGMVVTFTPTIGFQTLLAVGLATVLNANRPIAIIPQFITNPVTMAPIYAFTYYLGSFFWPGPDPAGVARVMREAARELQSLDALALRAQASVFLDLGVDVLICLWIGGLVVGAVAAAITYPLVVRTVVRLRRERRRRRRRRRRRVRAEDAS